MMIGTLRKKILLGYGITLTLTVIVLAWAFVNLLNLGQASDAILRENYKSILAAENMIDDIERQDSAVLLLMLGYEEEGMRQDTEYQSQFLQWLSRAKDNITIEGEEKIIGDIDSGYTTYLAHISRLILLHRTAPDKATGFYHETVLPTFTSVRDSCVLLREINERTMFKASETAQHIARKATWSLGVVSILAIAVGLGFSLFLSSLLTRPLRQMMEAAHKIADGDYNIVLSSTSSDELGLLADEFNAMVGKIKAFHDMNVEQIVSEKQKSDAIIRSIDDGILVVDDELRVTDINPMAARALSVDPREARGKHFLEVVKSEQLFEYIKRSTESGEPPPIEADRNIFTVERGEERAYYQFSVTPAYAKSDHLPGVVLVLRDVTKLRELDRLKSEFVMTASHELRTPLTSIAMSIDLLIERGMAEIGEKEMQLLMAAQEEVHRLKALVSNLLDLSKIEAGKIDLELERTPVPLLFEKAMAVFKTQAAEQSVELASTAREDLPLVKADANKITWVLTNLISNALRYVERGGKIQLFAEQAGPAVHISVEDDGPGIPYEYQSKIFDKFVRVKTDKSVGGSGLGLAICREIVRAHGGTIWVDSVPGEGSTFTFTLPLAQ